MAQRVYAGYARLFNDYMTKNKVDRAELSSMLGFKHINHFHLVMQSKRPLPKKLWPKTCEVLGVTTDELIAADKEMREYRVIIGSSAPGCVLVEEQIAQGTITIEEFELFTQLSAQFGGSIRFQLFLELLREKRKRR